MPNVFCHLVLIDVSLSTEVNWHYPTSTTKLVPFWFHGFDFDLEPKLDGIFYALKGFKAILFFQVKFGIFVSIFRILAERRLKEWEIITLVTSEIQN